MYQNSPTAGGIRMVNKASRSSLFGNRGGRGGQARQGDQYAKLSQEQQEEEMLKENDAILDALGDDVKKMKDASNRLKGEVDEHNKILDMLSSGMLGAREGLRKTMGKLDVMMGSNGSKHMYILIVFVFLVFVALYYLLKMAAAKGSSSSSLTEAPK